jgi:cytochrome c
MCHAPGATGASRDPQAPPFRHLNRRMNVDDLGEGLATRLLVTHPAMPQFRFEPDEVVAIVRYLRSVQARPRT